MATKLAALDTQCNHVPYYRKVHFRVSQSKASQMKQVYKAARLQNSECYLLSFVRFHVIVYKLGKFLMPDLPPKYLKKNPRG